MANILNSHPILTEKTRPEDNLVGGNDHQHGKNNYFAN
jgi:hypothetical protein